MQGKNEKERVQFDFSPHQIARIHHIKEETGATTHAQVARDALSAYRKLLELGDPEDIIEIKSKTGEVLFWAPLYILLGSEKHRENDAST